MNDKINCFVPENGWPGTSMGATNYFPNYYQNAVPGAQTFQNPHPSLSNFSSNQMAFIGSNSHQEKFFPGPSPPYKPSETNSYDVGCTLNQVPKQNVGFCNQVPVVSQCSNVQQARPTQNPTNHIEMRNANNFAMTQNYSNQVIPNCIGKNDDYLHFTSQKCLINSNGFFPSYPPGLSNNQSVDNQGSFHKAQQSFHNTFPPLPVTSTVPLLTSSPTMACVQNNNTPPIMYNISNPIPHPSVANNLVQSSVPGELQQGGQFHFPPPTPPTAQFLQQNPCKDISLPYGSQQHFSNSGMLLPPSFSSLPPTKSFTAPDPSTVQTIVPTHMPQDTCKFVSVKERNLNLFLQKFSSRSKESGSSDIKLVEFRSTLQRALMLSKMLNRQKENLTNILHSSESEWKAEVQNVTQLQNQLSEMCATLSVPNNLRAVQRKLKMIQKRRFLKLKQKLIVGSLRQKKEQERENLNQEIDKWLDGIKEKNLKLKREVEMKKEADNILAEVRRKIMEANRTIEKIKVFEKLRAARQRNAAQKGLFILKGHDVRFDEKMTNLKATMLEQLSDYEAEERALRVMLETEQEGQLEEEALWRIQKMKTFQQKKQVNVRKCLFGTSEEPSPADPLFLFYQHQNSGNSSIENLVQIRHHWDAHLTENGKPVPQQWVVPTAPSSSSWETCLGNG